MCFSNPKNSKKIALGGHKRLENYPQILHQLYELKIWICWKLFSDNLGPNNLLYCCSFAKLYLFLLLCSQFCNNFHFFNDLENCCWWVWEVCCLWCVKSINICCFKSNKIHLEVKEKKRHKFHTNYQIWACSEKSSDNFSP